MGRRKNDEIINSELLEVDIYGDEDSPIETIGQRIRRIRIAKGLTQDDLAKLMGYSNNDKINVEICHKIKKKVLENDNCNLF